MGGTVRATLWRASACPREVCGVSYKPKKVTPAEPADPQLGSGPVGSSASIIGPLGLLGNSLKSPGTFPKRLRYLTRAHQHLSTLSFKFSKTRRKEKRHQVLA